MRWLLAGALACSAMTTHAQEPFSMTAPDGLTVEQMERCSAAAIKMKNGPLWLAWAEQTLKRHQSLLPEVSENEIQMVSLQRIMAQREQLEEQGMNSIEQAQAYFRRHCQGN